MHFNRITHVHITLLIRMLCKNDQLEDAWYVFSWPVSFRKTQLMKHRPSNAGGLWMKWWNPGIKVSKVKLLSLF